MADTYVPVDRCEKLTIERIKWKITMRATQSASQKDTGYREEKVLLERAKHWQATRTSTTAEGYVHRASGEKEVRELADGASWYWLRREMKKAILDFFGSDKELELEAFRMASGGEANWRVARDEGVQNQLLGIL